MPRNRQQIPKAEREAALVEQAWQLFADRGYKATSLAEVGRAAGVAANAVRWYFPTKDDLFAAALEYAFGQQRRHVESDPATAGDPHRELVALLTALQPYRSLHREAYERIAESAAVADTYARIQDWLELRLLATIAEQLPEGADVAPIADAAQLFFEGLLISARQLDRTPEELVDLLTEALVAMAASRSS